jgi:chemotaxis protein CheX
MHELGLEASIVQVVESVCSTMLELEVVPGTTRVPTPGARTLVGCVQIAGAWSGAVLVSCDPGFARLAARIIFEMAGEPSAEEERDALGELSNVIAGNLKTLLPAPSHLALPTVADGIDGVLDVLGSRRVENVELLAGGHRVTVTMVVRNAV